MRGKELEAHRAQKALEKMLEYEQMILEKGRQAGLIEAARALDARHNEYFNLTDKGSWHKAAGVREASAIVRRVRLEGAKA